MRSFVTFNKAIYLSLFCCFIEIGNAFGKNSDSCGVYFTKEQYYQNFIQLKTPFRLKEKAGIFWSDFDFVASDVIKLETIEKKVKLFTPGSIVGFYDNGIKFLYSEKAKKYFAVLNGDSSLNLLVDESESVGFRYAFKNAVFLFATNINDTLQPFTIENIEKTFSGNDALIKNLSSLCHSINEYRYYLTRKNFFKCQNIVCEYLGR
jgi:hypothetical protein